MLAVMAYTRAAASSVVKSESFEALLKRKDKRDKGVQAKAYHTTKIRLRQTQNQRKNLQYSLEISFI